ncbi:MAG: RdgB/HAM1 family non-canonical purine NTP pyrophosphatase [Candidatus Aenigmarchaeota archaeon]|nr:RdgB/HAM1 family non-canonical purine NTP pyrophosphatase [Candidatus Aenigmarchaeota archaeon]
MKSILLVTSNLGKVEEISKHLGKFGIKVAGKKMEMPEIGEDQETIAKGKAEFAVQKLILPVIVEDTGLYFDAYKDFPGIRSKFVFQAIGYEGILKLLENKSRKAYFKTVMVYCDPNEEPKIFVGINPGRIAEAVRGVSHPRLPYDSVFVPDGDDRTFAEMTKEEKAKYSARAKAAEEFARWFLSK